MTVKDVMSAPKLTVNEDEKMDSVMKLFDEYEVWYIPVTDQIETIISDLSQNRVCWHNTASR
jgi:predicted transcriptional regulator